MSPETPIQSMLILRTSDNQEFEIEQSVALQSGTIKHLVEDGCASAPIPIPNVHSETLINVIEYLKRHHHHHHHDADSTENSKEEDGDDDLKKFDENFVKTVSDNGEDLHAISDLMLAANYLDIRGLLDVSCQYVADHIKDKSVEEVRAIFNIVNDYTEEEEAEVRKENAWAFE